MTGSGGHPRSPADTARALVPWAAGLVAAIGAAALAGWTLDLAFLKYSLGGGEPMAANTALTLVLAGTSLWLRSERAEPAPRGGGLAARLMAAAVFLIGLLTLGEYAFGWDLGIDQILFHQVRVSQVDLPPGRMAPATALGAVLAGGALLLLDAQWGAVCPAEIAALASTFLSWIVVLAYAYGTRSIHSVVPHSAAVLPTAVAFYILSAGILCARPARGLMASTTIIRAGGKIARPLLPAAMVVPALIGWVRLVGERHNLYEVEFGLALMVTASSVILCGLIWAVARSLNHADAKRQRAEAATRRLNIELEHRVRERTAELEATNHELEAFSYSVSHDLRTPLRAISGFTGAVMDDHAGGLDPQAKDYLDRVRAATERMDRMIDDLLRLSRLGRQALRKDRIDLTAMARALAEEMQRSNPERRVTFAIADGISAMGDPRLLQIALENLLRNAWKFTGRQAEARIEVGARAANGELAIHVRDNGVGFDPTHASRMFTAFQRLHAPADFEGTGIGLATVQRIIRRHGGRVWAEGEVGKGATFYFTLPRE